MKDIPIDELVAISPEIYEAAARIGCTHVAITGQIYPGGRMSGAAEEAARFVEFSWLKAAVINGRAIFEEADPKGYADLLSRYGLGDEPYLERAEEIPSAAAAPTITAAEPSETIQLTAEIRAATKRELERQAAAEGISVGELLDWKFQPRGGH